MNRDENNNGIQWKRMSFKGNKVWAALDENGNFLEKEGKLLIKYNLDQNYKYWIRKSSLKPESAAVPKEERKKRKKLKSAEKPPESLSLRNDAINVFTDGASSGNPGPAGIGVYLLYGANEKQISEYIGKTTNNRAELEAIKRGLSELKRHDLPVRLYTDSSYCQGVLTKGWTPRSNRELISEIKTLIDKFNDIQLIKVKGHAGVKQNEIADGLATAAIKDAR